MSPQDNEHGQLRDRLIEAALLHIPFDGWGKTALHMAADDIGVSRAEADGAFPSGGRDMIAWHSMLADRRMIEALNEMDLPSMKIRARISTAVRLRFEQNTAHREAIRKGLAFLALPGNAPLSLKLLHRTVDEIWHAAGDTATDWNYYSKRMLLGGVYSSTLLCWLNDTSEGFEETWAFLDRRISDVMKIPALKAKVGKVFDAIPRRLRVARSFRPGGGRDFSAGRG